MDLNLFHFQELEIKNLKESKFTSNCMYTHMYTKLFFSQLL
jgi:hypothetical protein